MEYKKEIFINNIGILYPKINEKDINIFYLFNNIKTWRESLGFLCQEKKWDKNDFYEKKEFFFKGRGSANNLLISFIFN